MSVFHLDRDSHLKRQKNLLYANTSVSKCLRKETIKHYVPGQVVYNLGEYPTRFPIAPAPYDEELLATFAEHGVGLVQLHEEWNDSQRILGADKLTSHDPDGLARFIKRTQDLGMKIILYISTGFFEMRDPDFRQEWTCAETAPLVELYFRYAKCSPASAGWRAYLLPRLERILDEYGVDGLYDDLGYAPPYDKTPGVGHVSPDEETEERDAALEDLLGIVYGEIKRRGGVFKIHAGGKRAGKFRSRVYDYLWVGEGVSDLDMMREAAKGYPLYVVPCPDMSRAGVEKEDDLYLQTIPYLQFPLRIDGRPVTGERALTPGVEYQPADKDFWTRHVRRIHRHYVENPDGPYSYGWWDSCPGRQGARETWLRYFDLYRPMVSTGSRAWIEITDSDLFKERPPASLVASLFVNEETYLVLANYGASAATVTMKDLWQDRQSEARGKTWTLPTRTMNLLRRIERGHVGSS